LTHESAARPTVYGTKIAFRGIARPRGLVVSFALCVVTALVGSCGSSASGLDTTPAPSLAPSEPSLTPREPSFTPSAAATTGGPAFNSRLYAYGVTLPAGWGVRAAATSWASGGLEGRCPSDWDCFTRGSDDRTLAIASSHVIASVSLREWREQIDQSTPDVCADVGTKRQATLGGAAAVYWSSTCSSEGLDVIKGVALHAGRGYVVVFASPATYGLATDSALLTQTIATFEFTR
jgi:hypothetical protein